MPIRKSINKDAVNLSEDEDLKIFSVDYDNVIKSRYLTGLTSYEYALDKFYPLIDRLEIQRNIQDSKFYGRLEKDLVKGCIMPPITLAFVDEAAVALEKMDELFRYISLNIKDGFILDGIQRLNTLHRTFEKNDGDLNLNQNIYLNILICSSMDNLLYRMITLNNGQKPMSARHQIEILTTNIFEFVDIDKPIVTEKEKKNAKIKIAFNKADFTKGYLGFLANSTNIENQKIIEEKLDALIADKILDSNVTDNNLEFVQVVNLVNRLSSDDTIFKWFKNPNNLIGFCVGAKTNFDELKDVLVEDFKSGIKHFEHAFESFNFSKIKVGRIRRNLVSYYIQNYASLSGIDNLELVDKLSQVD